MTPVDISAGGVIETSNRLSGTRFLLAGVGYRLLEGYLGPPVLSVPCGNDGGYEPGEHHRADFR